MKTDVLECYLKGVSASKHRGLRGDIWRGRNYGRDSCGAMWTILVLALNH